MGPTINTLYISPFLGLWCCSPQAGLAIFSLHLNRTILATWNEAAFWHGTIMFNMRHWSQILLWTTALSLVVGRRSKLAASLDVQRGKIKSIILPRLWRWSQNANIIFFFFEQTLEQMIGQLACHRVVIGLGHLREVILERKKKLSWGQLVDAKRKNKLNENLFDDKYKKTNSTRTWLMTNVKTTWLTRPIK